MNVGASGKFELQPERPGQRAQCAAVVGWVVVQSSSSSGIRAVFLKATIEGDSDRTNM